MGLVSNAKWNAISQLVKITVQVINIIYLTRLIEPQDYGILAMAMVVFNLGLLLRDLERPQQSYSINILLMI